MSWFILMLCMAVVDMVMVVGAKALGAGLGKVATDADLGGSRKYLITNY